MQTFSRLLIPVLACSLALQATAADKYALLIGVTKYEHARMNVSPLKYPEDDANAVADLLKQGGYTVKVLHDANYQGTDVPRSPRAVSSYDSSSL